MTRTHAGAWEHGKPDPLCAICGGSGSARVRAVAPLRGVRRLVLWLRVAGSTAEVGIEDGGEARRDDRRLPCPSCVEADPARVEEIEGLVFVPARRT